MTTGRSWPPSAKHYHGFDRAIIRQPTEDYPWPSMWVDGERNGALFDQRKKEWYDWWTSEDRESHSCRPAWRCVLAAFGEVIALAIEEGCELPPWIVTTGRSSGPDRTVGTSSAPASPLLPREALRDALAEVWSGADLVDADAVADQLEDRGFRVEAIRSPL